MRRLIIVLLVMVLVILGSIYLATQIQPEQPEGMVISPTILVDLLVTPVPEPTRTPEPQNIPNWDTTITHIPNRDIDWRTTP